MIRGVPHFLPIPVQGRSHTTYGDLGLGDMVEASTRGKFSQSSLCHCDPMFEKNRCAFGQSGAAQTHLARNGVQEESVFLFFGLYGEVGTRLYHHRIFGFLIVEEVVHLGRYPSTSQQPEGFTIRHPHTIGEWDANNTLYLGRGEVATLASDELRLTKKGSTASVWSVPPWLCKTGLTYHRDSTRWKGSTCLRTVGRGQEFVADISNLPEAHEWLAKMIDAISRDRDLEH